VTSNLRSRRAAWQRDAVRIEIDLPWLMNLLGDTISRQVRDRGIALLEKPPGEA